MKNANSQSDTKTPVVDDSQSLREALKEAFNHRGYWLIHAGFALNSSGHGLTFVEQITMKRT